MAAVGRIGWWLELYAGTADGHVLVLEVRADSGKIICKVNGFWIVCWLDRVAICWIGRWLAGFGGSFLDRAAVGWIYGLSLAMHDSAQRTTAGFLKRTTTRFVDCHDKRRYSRQAQVLITASAGHAFQCKTSHIGLQRDFCSRPLEIARHPILKGTCKRFGLPLEPF